MDSLITAAAHALAIGDPLGALKRVALRKDAPALALRGTAMAQLGDLVRGRALLRQAARAYGAREALARARCVVAESEIALASRDLGSLKLLRAARVTLEDHGDRINAAHARYLEIRRLLLIGRLEEAERYLQRLDPNAVPPPLRTVHELIVAGIAARRVQARAAHRALARAAQAASQAKIPALAAEVEAAAGLLASPAACLISRGKERSLLLGEVESLLASPTLVLDACRLRVCQGKSIVELASRPVLFSLAQILAQAWPADVPREIIATRVFRAKRIDETYRARLRVEIGRLRKVLATLADVAATSAGYAISPRRARQIVVLAPPMQNEHAAVLALLADGESWSSSNLALALGASARTVQRALEALVEAGKVRARGRGRSRRYVAPSFPGITTTLLLPTPLTSD